MAKDVEKAWKKMYKVTAAFKDRPDCLAIAQQIQEQIKEFKPNLPLITALRNPGMRQRHWELVSSHLKFRLQPDINFVLNDLLKLNLNSHLDMITKISDSAGKEYTIENALDK